MKERRILLIEDNEAVLFGYERYLKPRGYTVTLAQSMKEARKALEDESFDAALLDLRLPDGNGINLIEELKKADDTIAIVVITGQNDVSVAVDAIRRGAHNFITKPANMEDVQTSLESSLKVKDLRVREANRIRLAAQNIEPYFGETEQMKQVMEFAGVAAKTDSFVLLLGETGTGKGLIAKWIHDHSERKDEPFVELNCSALRGDLLRSELYGHAKGAFTTAIKNREGLIEVANGGTLFLDEIGDMEPGVQAELLKTIEEKTFRRIGENKVRSSNFRLICATNRNLKEAAAAGDFRSDLYYRICVFPIELPSLKDRGDDIHGMAQHLLSGFGYEHGDLDGAVTSLLSEYAWPGNIRELRNMIERALLLAGGAPLAPAHFPGIGSAGVSQRDMSRWNLEEVEKKHIIKTLRHYNDDKNKASEALGISLATLYRKLNIMDESERVELSA
jgi:DNA-binding NtrC family response regulator